jgi:hypothetical protein
MNIFYLHPNPRRCGRWHCDKHVVKMILESCQLLYTAHWVLAKDDIEPPYIHCAPARGYKPTHANHPSAKWVRESLDHYRWLVRLTRVLLNEYTFRYGRTHACEEHWTWLACVEPSGLVSSGFHEPPQAMPPQYKRSSAVAGYRAYYRHAKQHILHYTERSRPHFL